jgi:hypothetical protein
MGGRKDRGGGREVFGGGGGVEEAEGSFSFPLI